MLVDRDHIVRAAEVIQGHVRRTPVMSVGRELLGTADSVDLKLELLQHTGSFKPRGALHRALTSEIPDAGLIAASGGNHGLAVAWVARLLGVSAEIFVPEVSPAAKVDGLRRLGATVRVTGALYDDALAACRERQAESGALDIHAYDHVDTIAGAGTIAREIDEQTSGVDTVVVSLGGGGLASGIAAWCNGVTRVITVEPNNSSCYASAVESGSPLDVDVSGVAADSLGARRIGASNWSVLRGAGAIPVTVDDEAIVDAQRRMWSELRLTVEPGGAAAAAALLSGAYVPEPGERVAVVVCGSNCDPDSVR